MRRMEVNKIENWEFSQRVRLLKSMHCIVMSLKDSSAYVDNWEYLVPAEYSSDDDFSYIAKNEDIFRTVVLSFKDLMRLFKDSKIAVGRKEY